MEQSETGEKKKVRKITEQTSWIDKGPRQKKKTKLLDDDDDEPPPPKPVEKNPLYSSREYVSDFSNPLYTSPAAVAAATGGDAVLGIESGEMDDQAPFFTDSGDMETKEIGMEEADTLF